MNQDIQLIELHKKLTRIEESLLMNRSNILGHVSKLGVIENEYPDVAVKLRSGRVIHANVVLQGDSAPRYNASYAHLKKMQENLQRLLIQRGLWAHVQLLNSGVDPKSLRPSSLRAALASLTRTRGHEINKLIVSQNRRRAIALVKQLEDVRYLVSLKKAEADKEDICHGKISWGYVVELLVSDKIQILYTATDNKSMKISAFIAVTVKNRAHWHIALICAHSGGKEIMKRIIADARKEPYVKRITLNSVPTAVGFYRKLEFENIRYDQVDDENCHPEPLTVRAQQSSMNTAKKANDTYDILEDNALLAFFSTLYDENLLGKCTSKDDFEECVEGQLMDMEMCFGKNPLPKKPEKRKATDSSAAAGGFVKRVKGQ